MFGPRVRLVGLTWAQNGPGQRARQARDTSWIADGSPQRDVLAIRMSTPTPHVLSPGAWPPDLGRRPSVGIALWRETLLDAAIFREAITNNSARPMSTRMAHLFCELFYRARSSQLNKGNRCSIPLTLVQLGETLGMGIATVNRTLQQLRASGTMDFRDGELVVAKWRELERLADFNPDYLHMGRQPTS